MRKPLLERWLTEELTLPVSALEEASSDASFRGYWRVQLPEGSRIVMDAPPDKESIREYCQIGEVLHRIGVHVPALYARDPEHGFVLMEDLGTEPFLQALNDRTADALYQSAIDALVTMQTGWPTEQALPAYDRQRLSAEMDLFFDWLLGVHLQLTLSEAEQSAVEEAREALITSALSQPACFVHRDYHSRNLMVCAPENPGVIDFQDAVIGPYTYDLVSLLRDCYVRWPEARVRQWMAYYWSASSGTAWARTRDFDTFVQEFDCMGVQRHLKAAGIFARLFHRDGKDGYLADIPQTLGYIADVAGRYPALQVFATLVESRVLPALRARAS